MRMLLEAWRKLTLIDHGPAGHDPYSAPLDWEVRRDSDGDEWFITFYSDALPHKLEVTGQMCSRTRATVWEIAGHAVAVCDGGYLYPNSSTKDANESKGDK